MNWWNIIKAPSNWEQEADLADNFQSLVRWENKWEPIINTWVNDNTPERDWYLGDKIEEVKRILNSKPESEYSSFSGSDVFRRLSIPKKTWLQSLVQSLKQTDFTVNSKKYE